MLPLREVRPRPLLRTPIAVLAIVAANLVAFLLELLAAGDRGAVLAWTFVPRTLLVDPATALVTIGSSMFLHAGWGHLLGNLLFLWIFGPSVEEALGPRRFLALYGGAGVVAALAQAAVAPLSLVPMLGASGAIGGVLAAYVSLHPLRRILALAFVFLAEVPAVFFVLVWFASNLLQGVGSLGLSLSGGGVAWWAHIGGFLGGLVLVRLLFPRAVATAGPEQRREIEVRGPGGERYLTRTFHPESAIDHESLAGRVRPRDLGGDA
jgi:membrane associated rhomboid family serine protease